MRLAGILETGETATSDEANDALNVLNDIIEQWTTGTLSVWETLDSTFTTVPAQSSYTWGVGGNFNAARPVRVNAAYCVINGVSFPIEVIGQEEYDRISVKGQTDNIILRLVYVNDMPLGRVILWPVPNAAVSLVINSDTVLDSVATLSSTITYPPGGSKALRYQLAVELSAEFGVPPSDLLIQGLSLAMSDYKRANKKQVVSTFDPAMVFPERAIWIRGVY